ncbi:MAG: hypothetical protein ABJA35_03560 [Parafilimonas sp.]
MIKSISSFRIYFLVCIITFFYASCNKDSNSGNNNIVNGIIIKESVDGCTYLIKLEDDKLLEPTNLSSFNVTLKDGQLVKFSYKINTTNGSICMMGQIVDLTYIADR